MNKQLFILCIAFAAIKMQSQNAIPNPGFELWTQNSIENPISLPFNSNQNCYDDGLSPNVRKVTPAYHGAYAIELKSITNQLGFAMNTDPRDGNINLWSNGIAFSGMSTGIRGYYKYNVATEDSAILFIKFRKNKVEIGNYMYKIGGVKQNFTLFDFNFSPALTENPDSLIFCLVASDFTKNSKGLNGSTVIVDSVSFKGILTQPALLDGSFETWNNDLMPIKLNEWNLQKEDQKGILRSTDAKTGQYAIQLSTYLGKDNTNTARAQPGYITSGYWDDNCGCIKGGLPYTLKKDTLAFWYKYTPIGDDQAQVYITFLQNNNQIGNQIKSLNASSTYQYAEIPFELSILPDHVVIEAISSQWYNSSLAYVGSTLLLDKMYFKSSLISSVEKNNSTNQISVWLNSATNILSISNLSDAVKSIELFDVTGKKVFSTSLALSKIDMSTFTKGVYYVRIDTGKQKLKYKLLKL